MRLPSFFHLLVRHSLLVGFVLAPDQNPAHMSVLSQSRVMLSCTPRHGWHHAASRLIMASQHAVGSCALHSPASIVASARASLPCSAGHRSSAASPAAVS